MDCKHIWEEIKEEKKFKRERVRKIAGYNGYSGWGGANTPFYKWGDNIYLILTEKCSQCGKIRTKEEFVKFIED